MNDRDHRRPKVPPVAVRSQLADPDSWDSDLTPLPPNTRAAIAQVDGRVKSAGQATNDKVEEVRAELRGDIRIVDLRVGQLAESVTALSVETANMAGKLDILVGDRAVDRTELSAVRVETVRTELEVRKAGEIAAVEVRKAGEIAAVDDARDRAANRRQIILKVVAGAGMVGSAILSLLLAHSC